MNYRFQNLLGAPYRGGNVTTTNNTLLISPVGNRISVTDLTKSSTITLPFQSSSNVSRIAVSPSGVFLLSVDDNHRAQFINLKRQVVLHRITFKDRVTALEFSPSGEFIAVGFGKLVQIWKSPNFNKEFFPFQLVRTFSDCNDKVTCLNWSFDSEYLIVGSKDLTARLFCVKKFIRKDKEEDEGEKKGKVNKPFLFLGHRDAVVGAFFGVNKKSGEVDKAYTITRDGYMFSWVRGEEDGEEDSEPPSPGTPEKTMGGESDFENVIDGNVKKRKRLEEGRLLHREKWRLLRKDGFNQSGAKLTACDYHPGLDHVVVGFSNGVFGLYQMPDFVCIHLLSI